MNLGWWVCMISFSLQMATMTLGINHYWYLIFIPIVGMFFFFYQEQKQLSEENNEFDYTSQKESTKE